MLMTNENVREYLHDTLLKRTLLRLIPTSITPNMVTVLRAILIPFNLWYVWQEDWSIAVPFFLLTAFTDVIDGSLARTRKQITMWGTVADPVIDKLFIASVVIFFVAREINPFFAIAILTIEVLIGITGYRRKLRGEMMSANWYGKIKMLLQCTGVTALLIARWQGIDMFVPFSMGALSLAIVFAIISLYTYSL